MAWKLFDRKEAKIEGKRCFYEKWIEPKGKSGIVFFCYPEEGRVVYVVEGYGVGTINPKTFRELGGIAPIQTYRFHGFGTARKALTYLKQWNTPSCSGAEGHRLAECLRRLPQIREK